MRAKEICLPINGRSRGLKKKKEKKKRKKSNEES
jgi:hypothetical protein